MDYDKRTCEDYDPAVEWSHTDDTDTVMISLPGFKKEELRVQVDNLGYLRVHGQRPAAAGGSSSNWIRVQKRFTLPDNCDIDGIRSKFANDTLTVTLPKKKSHPSPPDGSAPEPQEDDEEEQDEEEEEEKPGGGRRPIRWLLVTVAAAFFVGIAAYVAWRKLTSSCAGAGAGDHGPGELAGAGSYVREM
ncbi:unnamed protein product [Urochloa decumbens]|uniref:SHSP domain-containing protein n=1 Tax=Urochloa decumbens TaxID=240449 RepID=A0ABC8Y161_9POAL